MREDEFRQAMKKRGKKEHVVGGLVEQVRAFESYLAAAGHAGLEGAGEEELDDYLETLDPKVVKARMRGIGLYYHAIGNTQMAHLASTIREERLSTTRQPFKLRVFRGVSGQDVRRLEEAGIVTVEQMIEAARTPEDRRMLAERTGVSPQVILELVKLSDLSRLDRVKGVRARLYYDAGIDTPARFGEWEPEALRHYLLDWVERTGFDGIAPQPKEIRSTISAARALPEVVVYEPMPEGDR